MQSQPTEIKIVEIKIPRQRRNRQEILKSAKKITQHIEEKFLKGEIISLKNLTKKYEKLNITSACICNHITSVRKKLEKLGKQFVKIGGGKYQIKNAAS